MKKLGIVYGVEAIRDALNKNSYSSILEPEQLKRYELVGLRFSKGRLQADDEETNLSSPAQRAVTDRILLIRAIFFDPENFVFDSFSLPADIQPIEFLHEEENENPRLLNRTVSLNNASRENASSVVEVDYQFWDRKVDFVVFGKYELLALASYADRIVFSGAAINYGIGIKNYSLTEYRDRTYTTLKAEAWRKDYFPISKRLSALVNSNIEPELRPDTIKGNPCPPVWGPGIFINSFSSPLSQIIRTGNIDLKKIAAALDDFIADSITEARGGVGTEI